MKPVLVVMMLLLLSLCCLVTARRRGQKAERSGMDTHKLARTMRGKLLTRRSFCGRYGDVCSLIMPCCEQDGFDCDFYNDQVGKCIQDFKK